MKCSICARRVGVLLLVTVILAALSGCFTKTNLLYRDPAFPPPSFDKRNLVVGPIAWVVPGQPVSAEEDARLSDALGALLRERLARDLGASSVEPADYLAARLGPSACDSLLAAMKKKDLVGEMEHARLHSAFADSNLYVIFGRVFKEKFSDSKFTDSDGKETTNLHRVLHFDLQIYDPTVQTLVWRSQIKAEVYKSVEEAPAFDLADFIAEAVVNAILSVDDPSDGSQPPPVRDVAWKAFGAFTGELKGKH